MRWGPLASPQLHVLASQTHAFSSKRHAGRTHRRHFSPCTCCSWPISLPATPCRTVNPSARLRRPRGCRALWPLFTPHDKIPQGAGWPELGSLGSAGQANPRSKQLGAVAATMLRAVSRPMHTAFTHTGWAQQFWRLQSVRNPAPEREGAFLGCWFATFAAYHGEACMRPLRRQRRLPCRCGALSCGTTAGCAAATLRASRRSARSPMSWKLVGLAGLSGSAAASLMWASSSAPGPRCLPPPPKNLRGPRGAPRTCEAPENLRVVGGPRGARCVPWGRSPLTSPASPAP